MGKILAPPQSTLCHWAEYIALQGKTNRGDRPAASDADKNAAVLTYFGSVRPEGGSVDCETLKVLAKLLLTLWRARGPGPPHPLPIGLGISKVVKFSPSKFSQGQIPPPCTPQWAQNRLAVTRTIPTQNPHAPSVNNIAHWPQKVHTLTNTSASAVMAIAHKHTQTQAGRQGRQACAVQCLWFLKSLLQLLIKRDAYIHSHPILDLLLSDHHRPQN